MAICSSVISCFVEHLLYVVSADILQTHLSSSPRLAIDFSGTRLHLEQSSHCIHVCLTMTLVALLPEFGGALLLVLVRPTDLKQVSSTVADVAATDSAKLVMKSLGVADELCNVLPIDVSRSPIALRSGLGWIRERLNSTKSAVKGTSLTAVDIRKKQEPQHEVGPPIIS